MSPDRMFFLEFGPFPLNCWIYVHRLVCGIHLLFNVCEICSDLASFTPNIDNLHLISWSIWLEIYQFHCFFFLKHQFLTSLALLILFWNSLTSTLYCFSFLLLALDLFGSPLSSSFRWKLRLFITDLFFFSNLST